MMLSRDGIAGLVCLAVSVWFLALTAALPPAAMVPIGPAFYPRVVLSILAVLSVMLIAFDVHAGRRRAAGEPGGATPVAAPVSRPNYALVAATFIEFGLYIALLPELGFRITTAVFVMALQITLEWPRTPLRWLLTVAVAVATSLVCYIVFEDYLSVLLPRGSWSGL